MKNWKVYLLSAFLILTAVLLIHLKIQYGGQTISPAFKLNLWRITLEMNLAGKGARAKVRLTLPKDNDRQRIYNENFDERLTFYIRERPLTGNRIGFWRTELLEGSRDIRYNFSVQVRGINYLLSETSVLPRDPAAEYGEAMQPWLRPSTNIQSDNPEIRSRLKKIIRKEKNTAAVMRLLFNYVRREIKYLSEPGSKDALETLRSLEADCGGKARLLAAFSRAAGIPSRIVGGIILSPGAKKITHVWVENYIGGTWVPFDVVNNHFAASPANYLELYRGDYPLIKHTGLASFNYYFFITPETIPPLDQAWSLYSLPVHFQNNAKVLLMIPLGALVVTFFRVVIGIPTFGTFTPILLALAFREVSVWIGLGCLGLMLFLGLCVRAVLDFFHILVIPRISVIVTTVVMMTLAIMMSGYALGYQKVLFISLFPLIIITWMIERFSVLQVEDGTFSALKAVLGTTVVALAGYYVMNLPYLKNYLFAFPELMFVCLGILLILGRYTGLRLLELPRFWQMRKAGEIR